MKKYLIAMAIAGILGLIGYASTTAQRPAANAEFGRFEGTVVEIMSGLGLAPADGEPVQHMKMVLVESDYNGGRSNFDINENTVLILESDIEIGTGIVAFYDSTLAVSAIYPPQHHARVIVSKSLLTDQEYPSIGVLVDRFDENLVGNFHLYQLDIIDESGALLFKEGSIVFEDGTPFEGEAIDLKNRAMVVLYDTTTEVADGPDLIGPNRLIVLFERAVHPIHYLTKEEQIMLKTGKYAMQPIEHLEDGIIEPDDWHGGLQLTPEDLRLFWESMFDPNTVQIIVKDEVLEDAPTPFVCQESGQPMVPVGAIAEALGYNVYGEGEDIVIGAGIIFTVGVDSYFIGRMEPRQLFGAPVLQDGVIFVPLSFFHDILPYTAYITDGNIVVREEEPRL